MNITGTRRCGTVGLIAIALSGCAASLSPEGAFLDVADTVEARTGQHLVWDVGSPDALAVRDRVEYLLSTTLTSATSVQIALLNNRGLQARYAEIGIAQADLVQAMTLPNPIVDGAITFSEGPTDLVLAAAMNFIELLRIPLKTRVAESALEETKLRTAIEALGLAGRTHIAFIEYQSQQELVGVLQQVLRSLRATVDAAKSLREAGNITALDFGQQRMLLTQGKLELARAQIGAETARETLNELMGLTGPYTEWHASGRLPSLPAQEVSAASVEKRAIEASLELAEARQKLITLAERYQLTRAEALIPDLAIGGEYEVDEGVKEAGPIFQIELPLFDRGRARKARAYMQISQARDVFTALAVKIRSTARRTRAELLTARKTARYYARAVLPQNEELVTETQRGLNAGQIGVFQLIQTKRNQILAGQQSVRALANYWKARARFILLMTGKLPPEAGIDDNPVVLAAESANKGDR
jgi:cobalt-zinc-cadmium efflux system outer membrane protein